MAEAIKFVPESDSIPGAPEWVEHESQKLKTQALASSGYWRCHLCGHLPKNSEDIECSQTKKQTMSVGVIPILLAPEKFHFIPCMLVMQIQH